MSTARWLFAGASSATAFYAAGGLANNTDISNVEAYNP
jgi:hypothetical protein